MGLPNLALTVDSLRNTPPPIPADDHDVGKFALLGVAGLLCLMAPLYSADFAGALGGLPVVGAMVSPPPPTPKYANSIGKAAPASLPESDMKKWFAPAADGSTEPYVVETWQAIAAFAANAGTRDGWAEACKKATAAAGADRAAEPLLGALACSTDGTVTALQRFAVHVLAMRAQTALFLRGVPGASLAAIQARQGELRLDCAVDLVGRLGGPAAAFGQACAKALQTAYLAADAPATFTTLGEAYATVATEIAKRDPKTAPEPSYFETPQKK